MSHSYFLNQRQKCKVATYNFIQISVGIQPLTTIVELRPQTDQRSDDSNLLHVKGETGKTVIKRYHRLYHDYIGNFQHFTELSL